MKKKIHFENWALIISLEIEKKKMKERKENKQKKQQLTNCIK